MAFTSEKRFGSSRGAQTLITLVLLVGVAVVFVGMREVRKLRTFEGVVVDKDQRLVWRYWSDTGRPDSTRYRHFLILETESGDRIRTRVQHRTYLNAETGDPVEKRAGEVWPQLMTEEAIQAREASQEGMRLLFDAVTN